MPNAGRATGSAGVGLGLRVRSDKCFAGIEASVAFGKVRKKVRIGYGAYSRFYTLFSLF
jgi:hypothetical protein